MQLYDRGAIAPGRIADLVVLENKNLLKPIEVYKSGLKYEEKSVHINFPKRFYNSVKCRLAVKDDFILRTDLPKTESSTRGTYVTD
jgi:adenine deaminase